MRSVDLRMTRLQLFEDTGLCERAVTRLEKGEVTNPLLANALANAEALWVSLDWLCGRSTNLATMSIMINERDRKVVIF